MQHVQRSPAHKWHRIKADRDISQFPWSKLMGNTGHPWLPESIWKALAKKLNSLRWVKLLQGLREVQQFLFIYFISPTLVPYAVPDTGDPTLILLFLIPCCFSLSHQFSRWCKLQDICNSSKSTVPISKDIDYPGTPLKHLISDHMRWSAPAGPARIFQLGQGS